MQIEFQPNCYLQDPYIIFIKVILSKLAKRKQHFVYTLVASAVCYMKKPSEKEVLNLDATVLQRLHDVCLKRRIELCKIPWQVGRSDLLTFVFVHYATDLERAIDIALADVKGT